MKIPMRDAGIPMLTEIITTPTEAATFTPAPADTPTMVPTAGDVEQLAEHVRDSVLAQLESHYEALLGERLRLRLADRLNALAADLEADIKAELLHEIREMTARHTDEMIFNKK